MKNMKNARRYFLDAATILSLLVAILVGAVWTSRLLPSRLRIPASFSIRSTPRSLLSVQGGFNYVYVQRALWNSRLIAGPALSDPAVNAFRRKFDGSVHELRGFALCQTKWPMFRTIGGRENLVGNGITFKIGFGYFVVLFLVLPAFQLPHLIQRARQKREKRPNRCATCDYDVRASAYRCPECSTPVTREIIWPV
jgi:hypothetical protein